MVMKTIAVDVDDVLAVQAAQVIAYSNRVWGTSLSIDDYTEHWEKLWGVDVHEVEKRSIVYHESGEIGRFLHYHDAVPVLRKLKETHKLIVLTARKSIVKDETLHWIDEHFNDIFDEVHFAGFYDQIDKNRFLHTKAELAKSLGADYLIDDQLKHCLATASVGIETILFGNYPWNQHDSLPKRVTRCHAWSDVERYFAT